MPLTMNSKITENFSRTAIEDGFNIVHYKVKEQHLEKIWIRFEKAGFEPILIKGWAAAQVYPEPFQRQFTDIDLLIAPSRFDEALKFLETAKQEFPVDLHKGARHLDSVPFEDLFANSRTIKCGATSVRVLRPEDHLRVLCVHWLNDGGANRERLWDVYYAVANRSKDFDWQRCLGIVSPQRRRWIVCAIGLAHKYLELNIENTPVASEAKTIPGWLIKAVENEWRSDVRLTDLRFVLSNREELFKQIKKRMAPNPIQATIELEGDFDHTPRFAYQIRNFFVRLNTLIKKIGKNLSKS